MCNGAENVQWRRIVLNKYGVHGVHLVHAAVSNESGSTFAQRARPGTESVSVQLSRPPALHPAQDASSVAPREIDRIMLSDYVNKHGINEHRHGRKRPTGRRQRSWTNGSDLRRRDLIGAHQRAGQSAPRPHCGW